MTADEDVDPGRTAAVSLPRVVAAAAEGSTVVAVLDRRPPIAVSHDAGRTWREAGGGLPKGKAIAVDRDNPDRLLYAGRNRLFFSEDDDQQAGGFLRGHTIGGDNTVNGLPVLYRQDCRDLQVSAPSYGQIILVGCSNVTLSDVAARHVTSAVQLEYVHGAVVDGASIASSYAAIEIGWSESILVRNATLPGNAFGVNVWHSSGVTVDGINASRGSVGVAVAASNFVEIRRNDFVGNLVAGTL